MPTAFERFGSRLIQKASGIFSGLTFWIRQRLLSTTNNRSDLLIVRFLLLSVSLCGGPVFVRALSSAALPAVS
jgi:hypothetical protein